MYSSRGPLHPPPGSGQRRAWWCGAENVPAILELFQSFHLHSCSTILLLGPSIFFSQGLTCSNLKGLMLTAKQPEIALHGATYSSVCAMKRIEDVSCSMFLCRVGFEKTPCQGLEAPSGNSGTFLMAPFISKHRPVQTSYRRVSC